MSKRKFVEAKDDWKEKDNDLEPRTKRIKISPKLDPKNEPDFLKAAELIREFEESKKVFETSCDDIEIIEERKENLEREERIYREEKREANDSGLEYCNRIVQFVKNGVDDPESGIILKHHFLTHAQMPFANTKRHNNPDEFADKEFGDYISVLRDFVTKGDIFRRRRKRQKFSVKIKGCEKQMDKN